VAGNKIKLGENLLAFDESKNNKKRALQITHCRSLAAHINSFGVKHKTFNEFYFRIITKKFKLMHL